MVAHISVILLLITIVFVEASALYDPKGLLADRALLKTGTKEELKEIAARRGCLQFFYLLFTVLVMITNEWPAAAVLFIISFIPKKNVPIVIIDSIISLFIGLFILLNHFVLHIRYEEGIEEYIRSLF